MPNLRGWEWLILVALILLLFGAKRLPDAARGLGRSLRIFKAETKGLTDDSQPAVTSTPPQPAAPTTAADAPATDAHGQTPPAPQQ